MPERTQKRPTPPEVQSPEALSTYREMLHPDTKTSGGWKAVRRGAMGLAIFGLAGWIWRNARSQAESDRTTDDGTHSRHQG